MKMYICKNHDADGDLHLAAFTTMHLAAEFCRKNSKDMPFAFYEVTVTDNVARETYKYENRGL